MVLPNHIKILVSRLFDRRSRTFVGMHTTISIRAQRSMFCHWIFGVMQSLEKIRKTKGCCTVERERREVDTKLFGSIGFGSKEDDLKKKGEGVAGFALLHSCRNEKSKKNKKWFLLVWVLDRSQRRFNGVDLEVGHWGQLLCVGFTCKSVYV